MNFSASHIKINVGGCKDDARVSSPSKLKSNCNTKDLPVGGVLDKRSLEQSYSFSEGISPNFDRVRNGTSAPRHHALSRVLSEKSWSTKWKGSNGGRFGTQKASPFQAHFLFLFCLHWSIFFFFNCKETEGGSFAISNFDTIRDRFF